jgi:O-acetylserine/cysteine efflux transporter
VQTHVFFTIGLAILINRERVEIFQWAGIALAVAGIVLVGVNTGGDVTAVGIALVLLGGFNWGVGNIVSRAAGPVNMLAYVVWSSIFAVPPLAALALGFEGWTSIRDAMAGADGLTWLAVVWQAVGNSLFGFAVWAWLLARHSAASVVPMALLVPVFGMASSALWLGEPLQPWKIAAALLVIGGLAVNMLWPRRVDPPAA